MAKFRRSLTEAASPARRPVPAAPPVARSAAERAPGLAGIDDLIVPFLQWGARRGVQGATGPLWMLGRWEERVAHGQLYPWLRRHARVILLGTTLIAFFGSSVHFERYPRLLEERRAAEAVGDPSAGTGGRGADGLAGGAQMVGPTLGAPLPTYIRQRQAALAAAPATDRRVAVVSFANYLTPDEVEAALPTDVAVLEVQLRLPDAQAVPTAAEVVSGDLARSVGRVIAQERAILLEEIAGLEEYLASDSITDEDFLATFRADRDRAVGARNLLDSGAGTVFAVVVEGPVSLLRDIASAPDVRLVDLAAGETEADASAFFGIKPEDRDRATYGGSI